MNNNNVDNSSHRQQLAHFLSSSHNFRLYRETHRDTNNSDSNFFNFIINYKSTKINEKENKYKKNKEKENEYKKSEEKMNQDKKEKYLKNRRLNKRRVTSRAKKRTKKIFNPLNESKQIEFKFVAQKLIMRHLIFRYICEDIDFSTSLSMSIFTSFNQHILLSRIDRNSLFIVRVFISLKPDFEFYILLNYSLRQMVDY